LTEEGRGVGTSTPAPAGFLSGKEGGATELFCEVAHEKEKRKRANKTLRIFLTLEEFQVSGLWIEQL
jgi:hypothetical protein